MKTCTLIDSFNKMYAKSSHYIGFAILVRRRLEAAIATVSGQAAVGASDDQLERRVRTHLQVEQPCLVLVGHTIRAHVLPVVAKFTKFVMKKNYLNILSIYFNLLYVK